MRIEEELFDIHKGSAKINSKRKGDRNELNLAHLLTEWTGTEFTRVPRSGGLRWKDRSSVCGDVVSTEDSTFPYSIETKFYKNLGLAATKPYLRSNSVVYRFMKQAVDDAKAVNKKPILMLRENGMPKDLYYVFFPNSFVLHLGLTTHSILSFIGWNQDILGMKSTDLFKIPFETFKTIY